MMDIVFQSGDFYYGEDATWPSVIKDVLLPIVMLGLGYGLNTLHDKIKEKKRLKNVFQILRFEVQALPVLIADQKQGFEEFVDSLSDGNTASFGVRITHNLMGIESKFSQFAMSDLLSSVQAANPNWEEDKIQRLLYNLIEGVRLVDKILIEAETLKIRGLNNVNEIKAENSRIFQDLSEQIRSYQWVVRDNPKLYQEFMKEAVTILNNHLTGPKNTILFYGRDTFINPLTEAANEHMRNCTYARDMLKHLYIGATNFRRIESEVGAVKSNFTDFAAGLQVAEDNVKEAFEIFHQNT